MSRISLWIVSPWFPHTTGSRYQITLGSHMSRTVETGTWACEVKMKAWCWNSSWSWVMFPSVFFLGGGVAIVVCFCWTGSNGKSSKVDDLLMTSIKKATRFFRQRFFSPGMGLKRYTSYPRKGFFANSLKTFAEEQRKLWSQVGEWRSIRVQWWRCLVESSKGRKCTTQAQSCRGEIGVSTNSRFCLKDLIFPSLIWSLPDPESMKAGWNKSFCPSTLSRTTGSENAKSSPRTRWACCPSLTLKQKLRII